jgi:hypothetical protein
VEGRFTELHVFGHLLLNRSPWYFPFAVLSTKLPLGSLALLILGVVFLFQRRRVPPASALGFSMLGGFGLLFLVFMAGGSSAYAGIRHLLPAVVALTVCAGVALKAVSEHPVSARLCWVLVAAAGVSALPQSRPWEYFNALVGGSARGYLSFSDESVGLGQRMDEYERYYHATIQPSGLPVWDLYGTTDPERTGRKLKFQSDSAHLDGYVAVRAVLLAPRHYLDLGDLKDAAPVARFGELFVFRGNFEIPWLDCREDYLRGLWFRSQQRPAEEIAELFARCTRRCPNIYFFWIQYANSLADLGRTSDAVAAYRQAWATAPEDDPIRRQLDERIAALQGGAAPQNLHPIRDPALD